MVQIHYRDFDRPSHKYFSIFLHIIFITYKAQFAFYLLDISVLKCYNYYEKYIIYKGADYYGKRIKCKLPY